MSRRDQHLSDDDLVRLSLTGPEDTDGNAVMHLETCADCRAGADEITRAVRLGPGTPDHDTTGTFETPPDDLWARIEADTSQARRPSPAARWITAAAAIVGCLAGAGATALVLANRSADETPPPVATADIVATAALSDPTEPGAAPEVASGTAKLVNENGRWTLVVDTRGLSRSGGYFEVWLLDADGRMYALGALPEDSTARLAVPKGISVAQFNVVDISAQQFNGDPAHSRDSVLRGTLST